MGENTDNLILEDVLASLADGREPDLDALSERFPGNTEQIERVLKTAGMYLRATRAGAALDLAPRRLASGERLGDFEVTGFLGQGGMAQVYRARQLSLGRREVALKVLPREPQSSEARRRFEREGLLLSGLHHPNLAEVYGVGEQDGRLFLAMRLVEGPTLRALQTELGLPNAAQRRRILSWGADLASALALVHENGLVHRDVKPSNVIIERSSSGTDGLPTGGAVLVDFGLVRLQSGDFATRTVAPPATLHYAPPEQILGADITPRADVFALGVTLHDLIAGRSPGERPPASAGLPRLDTLVEGLDLDLVALVARAVDPDPRWRFEDAGALHQDIVAWLAGLPVSARRRSWRERVWRGVVERPERLARGVLAAALALLVLLGLLRATHWVSAAEQASAAFTAGDLLGVSRASAELPVLLHGVLLPAGARNLARRLAAERPGDPLDTLLGELRRNDPGRALFAAATHLRRAGYDDAPWVRWFFERTVERALSADAGGATRSLHAEALRLLARLFYERPIETPAEVAYTASLRALARRALLDPSLEELDRLYALSALGGCGTAQDLGPLLEATLEGGLGLEGRRLGLSACNWILMREAAWGGLDDAQLEHALAALRPRLPDLLATPDLLERGALNLVTVGALNLAFRLAQHERGGTPRASTLLGVLPPAWWAGLEDGSIAPFCMNLLCQLGDPRARARLLAAPWPGPASEVPDDPYFFQNWGSWATWAGDSAFCLQVEARCRAVLAGRSGEAELLAAFREGAAWSPELNARIPDNFRLDPDTLLGSDEPGAPRQTLPSQRVALATSEHDPAGSWRLRSGPLRVAGCSTGLAARGASVAVDELGDLYLRLPQFGSSELVLEFELPSEFSAAGAAQAPPAAVLVLDHMAARRDVYPFHGEAFLEVRLNGFVVIEKLPVDRRHPADAGLPLRAEYLRPGANALELRLHVASTTTYRFLGAQLSWWE